MLLDDDRTCQKLSFSVREKIEKDNTYFLNGQEGSGSLFTVSYRHTLLTLL